jgi:GH24 family phage-related lysozyme (muramidase)
MNYDKLAAQLVIDEDKRTKIYTDTAGKVTGGVGRNLTDRGFSEDEIQLMLRNDIKMVEGQLDANLPWWREMSDDRQNVLANMCFNMGITKLLRFKTTLGLMQQGRYPEASSAMLNSVWAKQVKGRADRLAAVMKGGANA